MRKNRFEKKSKNPATKFLSWSSQHKAFTYYDKEKGQQFKMPENFKFLILAIFNTVKGWSQKNGGQIISNEVVSPKDILDVRLFKDAGIHQVAKGSWEDIKDVVKMNGGNFTFSLYAMDENGELINIAINKSAMINWIEFSRNERTNFYQNWVVHHGFDTSQNGAIVFSYPKFQIGNTLNTEEQNLAEKCEHLLSEYEEAYFGNIEQDNEIKNAKALNIEPQQVKNKLNNRGLYTIETPFDE